MTDGVAEPTLPEMVDRLDRKLDEVVWAANADSASRDRQTAMLDRKLHKARLALRISIAAVAFVLVLRWWDDRQRNEAACQASNQARIAAQERVEQAGVLIIGSLGNAISTPTVEAAARLEQYLQAAKDDYVASSRAAWSPELKPKKC